MVGFHWRVNVGSRDIISRQGHSVLLNILGVIVIHTLMFLVLPSQLRKHEYKCFIMLRNAVRAIVVCLRSMVDGAMAMVDGAMAMVDGR